MKEVKMQMHVKTVLRKYDDGNTGELPDEVIIREYEQDGNDLKKVKEVILNGSN